MASSNVVLVLLCIISVAVGATQITNSSLIELGSSLSPVDRPNSWHSLSGRFAFGFYPQGSGFQVGIRLVPGNVTTWTANRGDPPVSSNAALELTTTGELLLRTEQSKDKVLPNTTGPASFASMLDTGNFVLYNKDGVIIWESFHYPTDTILGGQSLSSGSELISSLSETNFKSGQFRLKMQGDGNLVLYPINTLDHPQFAYWDSNTYTLLGHHLYLNTSGELLITNNTHQVTIPTSFYKLTSHTDSLIYRATLGFDGRFQLYSHYFDGKGVENRSVVWSVPDSQCKVKGFCGFNSYCTMNDVEAVCRCLPGTDFVNPNLTFTGCERNFTKDYWCKGLKQHTTSYSIVSMDNIKWSDYPYFQASISEEDCKKSCFVDCDCEAALYESGNCKKYPSPLKYASRDQQDPSKAFFKVGTQSIKSKNGAGSIQKPPRLVHVTSNKSLVVIRIIIAGIVLCSCIPLCITGLFLLRAQNVKRRMLLESGSFGLTQELTLRAFSYKELRKATNGFKDELGRGAFGSVYKGTLYKSERPVAVKRLEKVVTEGEKEFHAEMIAIERTHHKNLVRLLGYCAEASKRLLVYEYMSNGSLADLLFRAESKPDWSERERIALDVASGILYLHEECGAPIIHCDIKPQNILMDDFWKAKISDFGLAKLLMPDQTRTFTLVRGTRGYMAPEWQRNTPISVKADVYSFGIVLLEIVCCRRNMDVNASKPEQILLSFWVYKCFSSRELEKLVTGQEVDKKTLERMVKVGLWCIQDEPSLRPSMKTVVLMLEGITDIPIPPCPTST